MPKLLMVDMGAAWGGQEIYSKSLTQHLLHRGWEVTHLSPHSRHAKEGSIYLPISIDYADFLKTARMVSSLQEHHDIVHFNGNRAIYLSNFCKKSGAFVGTKHSPYATEGAINFKSRLAAAASQFVFQKLDRLISISDVTLKELPARVRHRSEVVLNGVDDLGVGHERLPSSQALRACFVGRFVESKGIMRLLEAVHLLKNDGLQFSLLLAGGGPLEKQARDFVLTHGLNDVVTLLGFLERPGEVYRQSHICILPSLREGLPLTLLEAMSANCALVGHDIPGVSAVIVQEHNGLIAPVSASGLAQAIKRFAQNPSFLDRTRCQARADYEKKWRVERMVDDTEAVYRSAMTMTSAEEGRLCR